MTVKRYDPPKLVELIWEDVPRIPESWVDATDINPDDITIVTYAGPVWLLAEGERGILIACARTSDDAYGHVETIPRRCIRYLGDAEEH